MSTHDDHSSKDDHSKTDPNEGVEQNQSFAWLIYVVIILLLILGVYSLVSSTKKQANQTSSRSESAQQSSQPSSSQSTQTVIAKITHFETKHADIKPGEFTKVEIGSGVAHVRYKNATVKYCSKNLNGILHCSKGTEDIGWMFPLERSADALTVFVSAQDEAGGVDVELEYE